MLHVSRLIAFAVLVWLAQGGQPPPSQQPEQPSRFRAGTNLVRVDVYATKDGAPIQDLAAQDFEVFEDGAPQKIESFEHITVLPAGPDAGLIEPAPIELVDM